MKLAVVSALATSFATGCGSNKTKTAYCVGPDNRITQNYYCDNEYRPGYFYYMYGARLSGPSAVGTLVNSGERIDASDKATNAMRGGFGSTASQGVGRSYKSSGG